MRFPEFCGEWEKRTLGEITINFSKRNKDKVNYPMYSVTNNRGFIPQTEQFEERNMQGQDIMSYKVVNKGDFAYNPARINVGSIAKYNGSETCMISSLYVCFKTTNEVDSTWLEHLLKSPKMNFYYNINGEGGVRVYLFYPNFARIRTSIPTLTEQKKIAKFLSLLDQRIALQRSAIEKLKSLKSAIVDTIISRLYQCHSLVKISEICSIADQIKDENPSLERILTVKLHCKGIRRSVAENLLLGATTYYIRKKGQIIYGKQNFHNGAIAIIPENLDGGITSKDIPSFEIDKEKCDPYFLLIQLQQPAFYEKAETYTTGTGSKRLKEEAFLNLEIVLPSLREQTQIAETVKSISLKIENESLILNKLISQKTYLLSKMFI